MTSIKKPRFIPAFLAASIFVMTVSIAFGDSGMVSAGVGMTSSVTPNLGETLMTKYAIAYEFGGLVLVAALIGGVYLAKKDEVEREAIERSIKRKPRFEAKEAEQTMEVSEDGSG